VTDYQHILLDCHGLVAADQRALNHVVAHAMNAEAPFFRQAVLFQVAIVLCIKVQAGELFARLVTNHGFKPELRVIRGHYHLTQVCLVNTEDESLSAPMMDFLTP
jgi:hypothetical protein